MIAFQLTRCVDRLVQLYVILPVAPTPYERFVNTTLLKNQIRSRTDSPINCFTGYRQLDRLEILMNLIIVTCKAFA